MGYLTKASGLPDFSKVVISMWFRVPQASIDAASAEAIPTFDDELVRTIPLITFGPVVTKKRYEVTAENVRTDHWDTGLYDASDPYFVQTPDTWDHIADDKVSPCYVGLTCDGGVARLTFNIQMNDEATVVGSWPGVLTQDRYLNDQFYPEGIPDPGTGTPGSGWEGEFQYYAFSVLWDVSSLRYNDQPEVFTVESPTTIAADRWHHLLLSFDLTDGCSTQSPATGPDTWDTIAEGTSAYCKMWYAIDDVDKRGGANMAPYAVDYSIVDDVYGGTAGDQNGILTKNAWTLVSQDVGAGFVNNAPFGPSTCVYATPPIPTSGESLGIPSSAAFVDHVYVVEKAELQVYTGVTLDTSDSTNRRAFVTADGRPQTDFTIPDTLLGKSPEIRLHGRSKWKAGTNTGTAGNLTKTGTINSFDPGPSLT